MTPEERARDIGWCTCMARNDKMPRSHDEHCIATKISAAIHAAVNEALEEAAVEIEALERGTYTSAQTPARLVRAMKVK